MSNRLAADYGPQDIELAKATYLTVARVLGAHADNLVVVGGFVPYSYGPRSLRALRGSCPAL